MREGVENRFSLGFRIFTIGVLESRIRGGFYLLDPPQGLGKGLRISTLLDMAEMAKGLTTSTMSRMSNVCGRPEGRYLKLLQRLKRLKTAARPDAS